LPAALLERLRASRTFHAALATVRQLEFGLFDLRLHRHAGEDRDPARPASKADVAAPGPPQGVPAPSVTGGESPASAPAVLAVLDAVRREVSVLPPPAWNRMPWSFSHIFAGGYAAGYYSYKWAEVLSADAFAAFEEGALAAQASEGALAAQAGEGNRGGAGGGGQDEHAKSAADESCRAIGRRFRDTILAQGGSREAMAVFVDFRGRKPSLEPLLRQSGLAS
jgi:oligopeptidase A